MLVLTRRNNESIVIETPLGPVEIKVLKIKGSQVHLGIDASEAIKINRKEVAERETA